MPPDIAPSASFDAHFANVPGIVAVSFDAQRCAQLLIHPHIGMWPQDLLRTHILVRPDYDLGCYAPEELEAIRAAEGKGYDTESASCALIEEDGPYGRRGDVLIKIVYGAGYSVNRLLCHQGVLARILHAERRWQLPRVLGKAAANTVAPGVFGQVEGIRAKAGRQRAKAAMKDPMLRPLRRGVIQIEREK